MKAPQPGHDHGRPLSCTIDGKLRCAGAAAASTCNWRFWNMGLHTILARGMFHTVSTAGQRNIGKGKKFVDTFNMRRVVAVMMDGRAWASGRILESVLDYAFKVRQKVTRKYSIRNGHRSAAQSWHRIPHHNIPLLSYQCVYLGAF